MNSLSKFEKGQLCECFKRKDSYKTITERFNISYRNLSRLKKRFKKDGNLQRKPGSGRRKKWKQRDVRRLKKEVLTSKHGTVSAALAILNLNISQSTGKRMLHSAGLCARRKIKKPNITSETARKRLQFAKKYLNWEAEDWNNVFFMDETKVNMFGSDGIQYYWDKKYSIFFTYF